MRINVTFVRLINELASIKKKMKKINKLFKKLFSKNEEDIGFSEKEILEAEKRLGINLPNSIKNIYLYQVRNRLINSCHNFSRPEHLIVRDSEWLVFYIENQGIWTCAMNLKDLKVYINYEGQGYEEVASSLEDFLIVLAACDYSNYIYPYRIIADNISQKDLDIIASELGKPKSRITPPNYFFERRLYWDNEDEIVGISEWKNNIYNGRKSIFIQAFSDTNFERYYKMNENVEWKVLSQNKLKAKRGFTSYIEHREESYKNEMVSDSEIKEVRENDDFDLPF